MSSIMFRYICFFIFCIVVIQSLQLGRNIISVLYNKRKVDTTFLINRIPHYSTKLHGRKIKDDDIENKENSKVKSSKKTNSTKKDEKGKSDNSISGIETINSNLTSKSFDQSEKEKSLFNEAISTQSESLPLTTQGSIPPEVIFFGEPRIPPPVEAARDSKYHGSLLYWARHATVAPRSSAERIESVFPKGPLHPEASKYRLTSSATFETIYESFVAVMNDLEASKAFINVNMDIVPSKLFLRALTARKLKAQYENDISTMETIKLVRNKYIIASDQLFFPLNIEIQKAETRVMTYLSRDELVDYAKEWDKVEATLHFTTLLAARITWDTRVKEVLDSIKQKIDDTVGYMAESLKKDLMNREFRKPAITAEIYANATNLIELKMSSLYLKVSNEIKFVHETFSMTDPYEIKQYATNTFCTVMNIPFDVLKGKLKLLEASLAGIEGADYISLRLRAQKLYMYLCTDSELLLMDKWYKDLQATGYGFETYAPDLPLPRIIEAEQRIRDTGNEFSNFAVQVLKMPTVYSDAFSDKIRPRGATMNNWLSRDNDWEANDCCSTYEEEYMSFREAYIQQSTLRKQAEERLQILVANRMNNQDRVLMSNASIIEFSDNDID